VAQIVSTLGAETKFGTSQLDRFTKVDIHLPRTLCSVIKTLGSFNCEYGRFEVDTPVSTILDMLSSAYKLNKFNVKVDHFEIKHEKIYFVPWSSEGFRMFQISALGAMMAKTLLLEGILLSPPSPEGYKTRNDYLSAIDKWPEEEKKVLVELSQYYYVHEFPKMDKAEIGDGLYLFFDQKTD